MLAGDYRSSQYGDGVELAQVRPYVPGDDVRRMEWNVTARTGEPHVRVQPRRARARDVAPARHVAVDAVRHGRPAQGRRRRRRRDRDRARRDAARQPARRLTFGDREPATLPPRQGRARADRPARRAAARARNRTRSARRRSATRSRAPRAIARQRGIVVVVSDFRGPLDWRKPLLEVMSRHEVLAVEIRDPREQELPDVGELWLVDPETGRQVRVDTRSRALRERFADGGRRGAERRRARALRARCPARRALHLRRLAPRVRDLPRARAGELRPAAGADRAASPSRLLVVLWRPHERRRTAEAARFSNAALLPNLVAAAARPRGASSRSAFLLLALTALIVGAARPHANVSVPRKEATIVLAIDVSRSMTRARRAPVAARGGAQRGRRVPREGAEGVQRRGRRLRHARVRRAAADDRPRARARRARLAHPGRGHGNRRRRSCSRRGSGSSSTRPTAPCRRRRCS